MDAVDTVCLDCHEVDAGWSPFRLQVADKVFACWASCLGDHPTCEMIRVEGGGMPPGSTLAGEAAHLLHLLRGEAGCPVATP